MKKVFRKEEGVSPVIATILMVAITVVLAATVYIMVSGMGGTGEPQLAVTLTYSATQSNVPKHIVVFTISMQTPSSVDAAKVTITVGGTPATGNGTASIPSTGNSATPYWGYLDLNGDGKLSSGDVVWVVGNAVTSGALVSLAISGYSGTATVTIP